MVKTTKTLGLATTFTVSLLSILGSSVQAITLNQVDDFESLTSEGWGQRQGGLVLPVEPTGGPSGEDDAFLVVTSGQGTIPHIAAFNTKQWSGNYRLLSEVR